MHWISGEVINMLHFLLPGFLAAWVYFGLTAHPRPSEFERVVQALIFTVVIQGLVAGIRVTALYVGSQWRPVGRWNEDVSLMWATALALGVGLLFARWANNDWMHRELRKLKFTQETSFPSEWYGVLRQRPTYVVLHLSGERRLYGWPEEWPSDPRNGHFSIAEGEWLDDENRRIPLVGVSNILVPATEVSLVELMETVYRPRETESHEPERTTTIPEQANQFDSGKGEANRDGTAASNRRETSTSTSAAEKKVRGPSELAGARRENRDVDSLREG